MQLNSKLKQDYENVMQDGVMLSSDVIRVAVEVIMEQLVAKDDGTVHVFDPEVSSEWFMLICYAFFVKYISRRDGNISVVPLCCTSFLCHIFSGEYCDHEK